VPSVRRWREADIPQFPARPAIERLLESCDCSRRAGVRDFAILMLLTRLGLRTVEVSRLELGDLHWQVMSARVDLSRATSAKRWSHT
jgi:integrase/recombinase XerD